MLIIDKIAYSSKLRYKSPALKALLAVGMLLICVASHMIAVAAVILVFMAVLTLAFSRVSPGYYLKLIGIPLGFLILSTLSIVLSISASEAEFFSLPVGGIYLVATKTSLLEGIRLTVVSLASVACLYFLTLTTPMIDIFTVLRSLRCPKLVIELMMLIYRYLFVVMDMAGAIRTSQNCRLGNKDFVTELRSMGQMLTVLLIRSMNRASSLFDAMESRCYDGELQVLEEACPAKAGELILVFGFLFVMLGFAVSLKLQGGIL